MRSLLSLLDGAARRSASQVTLESGQPVVYTTARGAEAESSVLPRTDLFEMIVAAVDDALQVELAVGNPVEFSIDAGAIWTVYAEPGVEGITVRARRGELSSQGLDIDLDYTESGLGSGSGEAEQGGMHGTGDVSRGGTGGAGRAPRETLSIGTHQLELAESSESPHDLSVAALDVPMLDDSMDGDGDFNGSSSAPAPAAFESGTWALADEDDFGVGSFGMLGEDDFARSRSTLKVGEQPGAATAGSRLPAGFGAQAPSEPEHHIGVPTDDDDDGFDPFPDPAPPVSDSDRGRRLSPTVKAMSAAPVPLSPPDVAAMATAAPRVRVPTSPGASVAQASTRREMRAMRSPEADTLRELPTFGRGESELNDVVADIGEGALVYVREPGFIETLAQVFLSPSITIDDATDLREIWAHVQGLPSGAILIVRCEDPSRLLGWILRRLEEGYRVFVETRARTPAGARRVLLGVAATRRAEQWLDSQVTLTLTPGEDGPQLVAS